MIFLLGCNNSPGARPSDGDITIPADMPPLQTRDEGVSPDTYRSPDVGTTPDAARRLDAGIEPDAGPPPPPPRADVNIAPGSRLAIFAQNWETFQGFLYSVDLDVSEEPVSRTDAEHPLGPDSVSRSFNNELYVIERGGGAIQVFDSDFNWLRELPVQGDTINPDSFSGANAQDAIVLPGTTKTYVSRWDAQDDWTNDDDIWIVDPVSGAFLGSIDLTSITHVDGLRLARAGKMVFKEDAGLLYVAVQDAGVEGNPFEYNTNGKVAVINTAADEVIETIELPCRNPWDITGSELPALSTKIFVSCSGPWPYDTATDFGGIVRINRVSHTIDEAFSIADEELGGAVSELRLASEDLGYVEAGFQHIASFNPETGEVLSAAVYSGGWAFSLGDFSIHASEEPVIADQSINSIVFGDAVIPLEQAPAGLAFLETTD